VGARRFLPRLPDSLEQLDLLLLQVAKKRRIQQDGIHFQRQRYFAVSLAAYVGEDVVIRYDPADMAVIRVFYQERFVCEAVCFDLAGGEVSLKEVISARREQRKRVQAGITERLFVLERLQEGGAPQPTPLPTRAKAKLKRYYNE
jgi:putative transposase